MNVRNECPDCGTELPPDAPAGVCPKCLLKAGMKDAGENSADLATMVLDESPDAATVQEPTLGHDVPQKAAAPRIGTTIRYFGDYELLEEIARGGMGVVYKARQVRLNRIVALKMILAGQFAGEADVKRFQTEAEAAAQLDHPGIVPIFEVGEHEGHHFFSMGLVEGDSLAQRISNGPLQPDAAAELLEKISQAIQYAHQRGVIHRDLKPANILVDREGQPRVSDFGLAKKVQGDSNLTATGQILGTPSYMPPEQASGRTDQIAESADVYSLGAILYATLTGRPPLQADNPIDTLRLVLDQEPVPPRSLNPKIPRDLEIICLKCLAKEPSKRYSSASALSEDLERHLTGRPILARPTGWTTRMVKTVRRRPALTAALASVVVAMVTLLAVWLSMTIRLREHRDFAVEQYRERHLELVNARIQEARAHRIAGQRTASLSTLQQVPRTQELSDRHNSLVNQWHRDDATLFGADQQRERRLEATLRREVIQTLLTPGLETAFEIPFGEVYRVRLSPDARYLAVCGEYSFGKQAESLGDANERYRTSVAVWELETGKLIAEKLVSPGGDPHMARSVLSQAVEEVSWSAEPFEFLHGAGHLILTFVQSEREDKGRGILWDPVTDETVREFSSTVVVVSANGEFLAQRQEKTWRIEETSGNTEVGTIENGFLYGMRTPGMVIHHEEMRVTNVRTREELRRMPRNFRASLVGPHAEFVVAIDSRREATLSRIADGTELARLPNVSAESNTQLLWRFSPDAKRLAYQTDLPPNMVGIWSVERNQLEALLPGSVAYDFGRTGKPQFTSFSPDGRLLALYAHPGSETLRIWDLDKREVIASANGFAPQWSADGRWFAGTIDPGESLPDEPSNPASSFRNSHGRIVKVWRVHRPPPRFSLAAPPVHTLLFDAAGKRLIANDTLWQPSGTVSSEADEMPALVPAHLAEEVSADALRFDDRDQQVRFVLPETPFREQTLRVSLAGNDDWEQLPIPAFPERLSGTYGGRNQRISDVTISHELVAFHPFRRRAAFAGKLSWRQANMRGSAYSSSARGLALLRYELDKEEPAVVNEPQLAHEMGRGVRCLTISPDGELIATGHPREVVVRRWSDGQEVGRAEMGERWTSEEKLETGYDTRFESDNNPWTYVNYFAVNCVAFSPDGEHLIAGADQGRLAITDRHAKLAALWRAHQNDIHAVAFHPDRQMVASAGADRTIRLWNVARAATDSEPHMLAEWEGDEDVVTAMVFHPGGRYLLSGSAGGVVTVWDLERIRRGLEQFDLAWAVPPKTGRVPRRTPE